MKIREMRVGNTRLREAYMVQKPFSVTRREPMLGRMRSSITDHHPQRVAIRKSTRWTAILVGVVALTLLALYHPSQAAEPGPTTPKSGTRAPIPGGAPGGPASPAGRVMPPPTAPRPTTMAPPPTYVGPTADITAVANAISCSHKSITITCTVKPGLALTKPVTIGFGFINSAGVLKVVTQSYVASTGNQVVFNDVESKVQPWRVVMNFTVSQDKLRLGDRGYSLTVPWWYFDLDPLYDITISPLQFTVLPDGCSYHESDSIRFEWYSPEGAKHAYSFKTRVGKRITINEFAWAGTEVSASAGLKYPNDYQFEDTDTLKKLRSGAQLGIGPPDFPLLPPSGAGTRVETLDAFGAACSASVQWTLRYTLRKYGEDTPGGPGGGPPAATQGGSQSPVPRVPKPVAPGGSAR